MLSTLVLNWFVDKGSQSVLFVRRVDAVYECKGTPCAQLLLELVSIRTPSTLSV